MPSVARSSTAEIPSQGNPSPITWLSLNGVLVAGGFPQGSSFPSDVV
jgi:hypothetical protein